MEIGHLQEVSKSYGQKGVVVLGFNSADDPAFAEELLKENEVTFANVLDASDEAKHVAYDLYRVNAVPTSYVVGRDGRIVAGFVGYGKGDRRGLEAIEEALAEPAAEGPRDEARTGKAKGAPGTVGITVRGPDGELLAGAIVRLHPTLRFWEQGLRGVSGKTDAEGGCALREVPAGTYEVSVQVLRPRPWVAPAGLLRVPEDRPVGLLVRIPDTEVAGRVTRADTREPLDSDAVSVQAERLFGEDGEPSAARGTAPAWADRDGRFTFVGLEPGTYRIRVIPRDGKLKDQVREVKLRDRVKDCDFDLGTQATGMLRVRVLDASGRPAEGLSFTVSTGPSSVRTAYPRSLGDGVFEFELAAGEREVGVEWHGEWFHVAAPVVAGKTVEREVRLPKR